MYLKKYKIKALQIGVPLGIDPQMTLIGEPGDHALVFWLKILRLGV